MKTHSFFERSLRRRQFQAILRDYPHLTDMGFEMAGIGRKPDSLEFKKARELLAASFKEFCVCCDFLSECQWRKTPNPHIGSSYALKHLVERHHGQYIAHGAFIAAVIALGMTWRQLPENPLCIDVGISSNCPLATSLREPA